MTLEVAVRLTLIVTEATLVWFLFRKRAYKRFPIFCAYVLWDLTDNLALYFIFSFYPVLFLPAYIVALALDSLFVFAVLVELAWSVLRPFQSSLSRGAIVAIAIGLGAVCAVIWPFAHSAAYSSYHLDSRILIHLQQTISIARILFFVVLAAFSHLLSISWRDREMQIATGLGFYSLISVAVSIVQAQVPAGDLYHLLDMAASLAYLAAVFYWVFSFARKEIPRQEFAPRMESALLAMAGAARLTRIMMVDANTGEMQDYSDR
jgi:hypothetical protein